ncbi:MAG: biopolymer transporter ExbD [Deltaproteobacteria bacterium]|nr:biopolymer transporter ExbD [Deltaproteobacteria bacterium]MBW2119382.1 biopolymer transporter ExbD [Deltaproteobacteria bacterium]MBW2344388.1 biopolymer transporter ExbD [Deltaproteobacteria bacterium]
MRFRKPKEEESSLGIAPLIDVVFLLLIFFMVTSHFNVASGIPIRLPKVAQKAYDRDDQKIMIVIDREGRTYLKGEKIDLKDLGPRLQNIVEKEDLIHLLLQADKDVKHGMVVHVMDLAKRAGVSSIIIAAQWEPKKVY